MKKRSDRVVDTERRTDQNDSSGQRASLPSFTIRNLQRCSYGSKRATFDVEFFDGLLLVGGELFAPLDRNVFVQAASIRNRYTGKYERTVRWSEELSLRILAAVLDKAE